jgi:hypothetical protein
MYYHVMHKDGEWRLYLGNSPAPVLAHAERRKVLDAARKLARQNGMKIVIHKATEPDPPDPLGETKD